MKFDVPDIKSRATEQQRSTDCEPQLRSVLQRFWGYSEFLPLQREAMLSAMSGQDALVVMPTGGGKSLCFQAPALCRPGLAVVVSPLIALMKDQVDGLRECGLAPRNSGLSETAINA